MKKKHFLWLTILLIIGVSCHKDDEVPTSSLCIADSNFAPLSAAAQTLEIKVTGTGKWSILSDRSWCSILPTEGNGSANITITLTMNNGQKERHTTLRLMDSDGTVCDSLALTQQAEAANDSTRYRLPIIFHVLYHDATNKKQYVREGHLAMILERVNEIYSHCGQDLGLEFYMVEEGPDGNVLKEPGVNRVKINLKSINSAAFMGYSSDPKRYKSYMWDPNNYINIFLYTFESAGVQGISHLPYLLKPHALEGLTTLEYEDWDEVPWPQCLSINNEFVYSYDDLDTPAIFDISKTIAHELGHFLGLRHAFSEDPITGSTDACYDSDFCEDTPTYNKAAYDKIMQGYPTFDDEAIAQLVMREDCETGEEFVSTNIMDYACGYMNRFTANQAARIRYVIEHSPYIPGPKVRLPEQQVPTTKTARTNLYVLKTFE